ncbi:hypothetical protein Bbelb_335460, partial [Branchiostoma belcheri]
MADFTSLAQVGHAQADTRMRQNTFSDELKQLRQKVMMTDSPAHRATPHVKWQPVLQVRAHNIQAQLMAFIMTGRNLELKSLRAPFGEIRRSDAVTSLPGTRRAAEQAPAYGYDVTCADQCIR